MSTSAGGGDNCSPSSSQQPVNIPSSPMRIYSLGDDFVALTPRRTKWGSAFAFGASSPGALLDGLSPRTTQVEIHEAVRCGDVETVRRLLETDRSLVQARGKLGRTPLQTAAVFNSVAAARALLEHGDSVRQTDDSRANALYYGLRYGDVELLRCLVAAAGGWEVGVGPIGSEEGGPLHIAARYNNQAVLRYLLLLDGGDGCCPAGVDDVGPGPHTTPLHVACAWGSTDAARALLEYGADPSKRNGHGRTAVDLAVNGGVGMGAASQSLVRLLSEEGWERHRAYLISKLHYVAVLEGQAAVTPTPTTAGLVLDDVVVEEERPPDLDGGGGGGGGGGGASAGRTPAHLCGHAIVTRRARGGKPMPRVHFPSHPTAACSAMEGDDEEEERRRQQSMRILRMRQEVLQGVIRGYNRDLVWELLSFLGGA